LSKYCCYIPKSSQINISNSHSEKKYWLKNVFIFLSQYLFIALSQYCEQKCLVWTRPKRLLASFQVEYSTSPLKERHKTSHFLIFFNLLHLKCLHFGWFKTLFPRLKLNFIHHALDLKVSTILVPNFYVFQMQKWF